MAGFLGGLLGANRGKQRCGSVSVRKTAWSLIGLLGVVIIVSFWWYNRIIAVTDGLVVPEEDLDVGMVWSQRAFPWTLHVHNPTDQAIEVRDIATSCNCAKIEPRSFVVDAGAMVPVQLTLHLWPRGREEASEPILEFRTELVPRLRDSTSDNFIWKLKGSVHRCPFLLLRDFVEFGRGLVEGNTFPTRQVDIQCLIPVTGFTASCDESLATVAVVQPTQDEILHRLAISLRPNLVAGDYEFNVNLKPIMSQESLPSPGLGPPPDYTVEVRASVGHDVYVSPTRIDFGALKIGEKGRCKVTFRSAHGKPFDIVEATAEPTAGVEMDRVAGREGDNEKVFEVVQRTVRSGNQSGRVRFDVKQEDRPLPYGIDVEVFYYGFAR
ncbi:MAG: hypothetical protein NTW96_25305 [Planctomycetia bacterium]|nr:hypothetical protein [Planctomycetia bacterium]